MQSAALDRRVRQEARILVREVRAASRRARVSAALDEAVRETLRDTEDALARDDGARLRRALPALGELLEDLPRRPRSQVAEYAWAFGSLIVLVLAIRAFVVEAFKIPSTSMLPTLEINDHIFVNKFIYGLRVPFVDGKVLAQSPDRGEVIVFIQPCQGKDFIKRVVGVAGDKLEIRCGKLYVNGRAARSEYVGMQTCVHGDESGVRDPEQCSHYRETLGDYTYDTFHDADQPARLRGADDPLMRDSNDFPRDTVERRCSASPNQKAGTFGIERAREDAGPCDTFQHYVVPAGHVFVMGDNRDGSTDSRAWGSVPIENIKGKALFRWLSYSHFGWDGMRWKRIGEFIH